MEVIPSCGAKALQLSDSWRQQQETQSQNSPLPMLAARPHLPFSLYHLCMPVMTYFPINSPMIFSITTSRHFKERQGVLWRLTVKHCLYTSTSSVFLLLVTASWSLRKRRNSSQSLNTPDSHCLQTRGLWNQKDEWFQRSRRPEKERTLVRRKTTTKANTEQSWLLGKRKATIHPQLLSSQLWESQLDSNLSAFLAASPPLVPLLSTYETTCTRPTSAKLYSFSLLF